MKSSDIIKRVRKGLGMNKRAQKHKALARYYNLSSILGNDWAMFYCIIGGRKTGKSYSVTDFLCSQKMKHKDNVKNYWMRISEVSTKAMLKNNADKLVDPDLKRKYNLNLKVRGCDVYNNGKNFMTVLPLSSFGKLKGVGFFDKDFKGYYNIVLDEFQLEEGEKRTSFDILYNFIGMCENVVRTTKTNIRVFLCGNTLEETCEILKAFNFIPERFGRFYLRSKRCIIDNLEPTEEYLKDRYGSLADILGGNAMSNYTNEMRKSVKMIIKTRTKSPTAIIKFSKDPSRWYTLWDGKIIKKYNREKLDDSCDIAMIPYLGTYYSVERRVSILQMYDAQSIYFNNLITQSYFEGELMKIRKTA